MLKIEKLHILKYRVAYENQFHPLASMCMHMPLHVYHQDTHAHTRICTCTHARRGDRDGERENKLQVLISWMLTLQVVLRVSLYNGYLILLFHVLIVGKTHLCCMCKLLRTLIGIINRRLFCFRKGSGKESEMLTDQTQRRMISKGTMKGIAFIFSLLFFLTQISKQFCRKAESFFRYYTL